MTVDGEMIITSYKEDTFGLTTTFYDGDKELFYIKNTNPINRIKHILPVKVAYIFDGNNTTITGVLPF